MAIDTSPQWRCSNRAEHGKHQPPAVAVVRLRHAANPHFLARCHACIKLLEPLEDDVYDVAYLLTSRVRRRPDHDVDFNRFTLNDDSADTAVYHDPSPQPAD